jgi:hypothetical protein
VLDVSTTTVSLRGEKEVRQLLDSLSGRDLINRTRRAVRAGAAVMRKDVRQRAQEPQYPRSFARIKTRNSTHGGPSGMSPATSVGPTSPLLNVFEPGAGAHVETPGTRTPGATLLGGPAGERSRDFPMLARRVTHPGFAARPLIAPAFAATHDEAADAAMDKLLEGLR